MEKLVIQVRLNEWQLRSANPNVPYSPAEIAEQIVECWAAGASVVHYHLRDPQTGKPATDPALYIEAERLIRQRCDIITNPTLGATMLPTVAERIVPIVAMAQDPASTPDCVPADMLTTNIDRYDSKAKQFVGSGDRVYLNSTNMLQELCVTMNAMGIRPVATIWDIAGIRLTRAFIDMGLMREPLMCEFVVFGEGFDQFGNPATIAGAKALIDFIPPGRGWHWMLTAIGANPFALNAYAIENGGHVTVGLGDHAYPELGFPTNADLVRRTVHLAESMGRPVATAREARILFGLRV